MTTLTGTMSNSGSKNKCSGTNEDREIRLKFEDK
jgi:hypothetical protein